MRHFAQAEAVQRIVLEPLAFFDAHKPGEVMPARERVDMGPADVERLVEVLRLRFR